MYKKWDFIWFLTKTLKRENSTNLTSTWAAYNSLITNVLPASIYCGLPLYPAPLTDWSKFYTALKLCQNISTAGKTIISLGPATLNQIEWNGMEAHMVMYLCLQKMYMKEFLTKDPEQENKLQSLISVYLLEFESKDFSNIKIRLQHDDLIEKITEKKDFPKLPTVQRSVKHSTQILK